MQENKTYYLYVKGKKVEVSEEIYRAYVQPERKQRMREYRAKDSISVTSIEGLSEKGFEIEDETQDVLTSLIENEEENELKAALSKALSQLKDRDRKIMQMVYFEGKSQKEVAEILGLDKTYISRRIKEILQNLKKFF